MSAAPLKSIGPRLRSAAELFDLTGRVALVTGSTRGLGRAMALGFANAGADVVVSSRKQDACDRVAGEVVALGRRGVGHACHMGRWSDIDVLVERVYDDFGRVDILVNNAGISPLYADTASITEELWDKVLGVNLKGPFRLTALVGTRMAAHDGLRGRVRSEGARERDHAWPVLHGHLCRLESRGVRRAAKDVPPAPRR